MGDIWLAPSSCTSAERDRADHFRRGGLDQGRASPLLVGAASRRARLTTCMTTTASRPASSTSASASPRYGRPRHRPIPASVATCRATPAATPSPFTFTSTKAGSTFQCSIDGSAFTGCTSPYQTPVLSDGSHTFAVRSIDSVGNASAPTRYTWTVNTAPPTAPTIDTKPSDPSNNAQPSLAFSDSDSGVSFQCNIDGGSFAGCTSPSAIGAGRRLTRSVEAVSTSNGVSDHHLDGRHDAAAGAVADEHRPPTTPAPAPASASATPRRASHSNAS